MARTRTASPSIPSPVALPADVSPARAAMRSGTAARLAGLSVATLRIWEHRYGVVSPPKSASGQRSYAMDDVHRLRAIKRLTLEGHAIGSIARLDMDELDRLASGTQASSAGAKRVLVVGRSLAKKLEGRLRPYPGALFDDLGHAEREAPADGADIVVVHAPSLQPLVVDRILALRTALAASVVIVVYAFGTEAIVGALKSAGIDPHREPVTGHELARLILSATPQPVADDVPGGPRRYDDAELATLAEMPSNVLCECPHHLAEIVSMLVGFERYSAECSSRNEADAALHRHLHDVTATARALFERALTRVVAEEGLVL